ncbi:hypothetical protein MKEN_01059800 [Mycena kentingensis (nom. inval.)]|nr:hypothetical protein MKEN_01059800 [Mycena kentingensis (nom. inval.)]
MALQLHLLDDEQYSPYNHQLWHPLFFDQPPSPTDSMWSTSSSATASPPPLNPVTVVCNAPLVAPIPLPYHSPTFLQFELPEIEEDLSHPPYTTRSRTAALKRKRQDEDAHAHLLQKRRFSAPQQQQYYSAARTRSTRTASKPRR